MGFECWPVGGSWAFAGRKRCGRGDKGELAAGFGQTEWSGGAGKMAWEGGLRHNSPESSMKQGLDSVSGRNERGRIGCGRLRGRRAVGGEEIWGEDLQAQHAAFLADGTQVERDSGELVIERWPIGRRGGQ